MLHVVRDKDTKRMVAMWRPPVEGEGDLIAVLEEGQEYVLLPNMTWESAVEVARGKAKDKGAKNDQCGHIYVYDDRVEAEAPEPAPTIASQIRADRAAKGTPRNAPVSLDEIEAAERTLNG